MGTHGSRRWATFACPDHGMHAGCEINGQKPVPTQLFVDLEVEFVGLEALGVYVFSITLARGADGYGHAV